MNVKVSIPVTVSGYTGQRDAYESLERDYEVSIDGEVVRLMGSSPTRTAFQFNLNELQCAISCIKTATATNE